MKRKQKQKVGQNREEWKREKFLEHYIFNSSKTKKKNEKKGKKGKERQKKKNCAIH